MPLVLEGNQEAATAAVIRSLRRLGPHADMLLAPQPPGGPDPELIARDLIKLSRRLLTGLGRGETKRIGAAGQSYIQRKRQEKLTLLSNSQNPAYLKIE
jgi:hypothetical protein